MSPPHQHHRAFALVEAIIAVVIVSVMMVAALRTVGASRLGQAWSANQLRALRLAQDLMAEIADKAYSDPDETPLFGPEASELLPGRIAYDDIDDYNGLSESPPQDRTGTAIPGLSGWQRSVSVAWVTAGNAATTSLTDTGIKRITVTVSKGNVPLARLVRLRTSAVAR